MTSVPHDNSLEPQPDPRRTSLPKSRLGVSRGSLHIVVLLLALTAFSWASWETRGNLRLLTGDDTTYLALSEAVRHGTYREEFRPSAPPHVKYPPAYPAWLIVARLAVGDQTELLPAVNVALVASALTVLFLVVRSIWGAELALALVIALSLSKGTLWMGSSYYSEALFLLLTIGTLAAAWRAEHKERSWAYVAIVLAAAAFLTRSAGVALVLAVGLWLLTGRRNTRELVCYAAVMAVVVGGWFGYVSISESTAAGVRSYAYDLGPDPNARTPDAGRLTQWWGSVHEYALYSVPAELTLRGGPVRTWRLAPSLLALYAGVPLGVWLLWKQWRAAACFLLAYGPMLIAFPYRDSRLVVPALPLLVLASLAGIWVLSKRLPVRMRLLTRMILPTLMFASGVRNVEGQIADRGGCDRARVLEDARCYGPIARDVIQAARHVSAYAPKDEHVLSWHAASLHLLTGRSVESALVVNNSPPDSLAAFLQARSIGYVLITPVRAFERRELAQSLMASCRQFVVELPLPNGSLLLRTRASALRSAVYPDACQSLENFRARFPWPARSTAMPRTGS